MSHLVKIQSKVRDPVAVAAACASLKLPAPEQKEVKLYSAEASGLAVQLPGWKYPVVCDLPSGEVKYDNFGGHWGNPAQLDSFQQAYAVEKAKLEARKAHAILGQVHMTPDLLAERDPAGEVLGWLRTIASFLNS